ncbi:T9SS type A sorting domain-containing protein [Gramella jeungdoensis]|uniref:T9SS type A sorting domain-containing protein n=1 Tax=Gramella jeungdoensis TaxID=708091 RepID=A0ABT0Z336_9FLAO|nr:T9SS type A sorting domain-containing protein [Gramella jeungdoensis]MCM8570151.1 T9SS type A sorting domain-containing protein [Gramella jeungdoensis]
MQVWGQTDGTISGSHTIPVGTTEEYNNLYLDNNNSDLVVNGTLIVHGDLIMSGNKAQFSMGDSAFVLVYGNFEASNLVNVSVSSYLIIQGNFIRNSGSSQGTLDISEGNIYIFGEVDGWPADFTTCPDYDGSTETRTTDNCDFGTEEDLEDNIESFPPEYTEKLNCYNVEDPTDESACIGDSVTFSVNDIVGVNYQWQLKPTSGTDYTDIGTNSSSITLPDVTTSMSGNLYRVVVRNQDTTAAGCKLTVSNPASLTVKTNNEWTGSINSDWNTAENWLCNYIPNLTSDIIIPSGLANYPVLNTGDAGKVKDLILETGASIQIINNTLEIAGNITSSGSVDSASGKIKMSGTAAQSIPSNLFLNNRIEDLEINNANGVTSNAVVELTGSLKVTVGTFYTNNNFTLVSDSIQTGLIDGSGNGEVIGQVKMQRYINPAFGYKYISSPFSNSTVGDFSAYINLSSGFPLIYRYDENRKDSNNNDTSGWEAYTNTASALNIMEGYAVNLGSASTPITIELSGTVNNGDYQKNLINHNGKYTKGFHLVGNPYPSPIDWNSASGWTKNNVDDAVYFFRADVIDQYTGTYSSFVNGISSSDGNSSNIIPSMQGFFVHVSDPSTGIYPSSGTLGMTNEVRVNDFGQQFIKATSTPKELIRISASLNENSARDEMVIYFDQSASVNFEKEKDALKLLNTNYEVPNLYTITPEGKELSINAISSSMIKSSEKVPLGLLVEKEGMMTISLQEIQNLSANLKIYLIDEEKATYVNLNEEDYKFHTGKAEYDSRFYLSFSTAGLPEIEIFQEPFSLMNTGQEIGIKMNLQEKESGLLMICNIAGQLIDVRKVQGKEDINIQGIKSNGVYMVSYISGNRKFSKKVLVKK